MERSQNRKMTQPAGARVCVQLQLLVAAAALILLMIIEPGLAADSGQQQQQQQVASSAADWPSQEKYEPPVVASTQPRHEPQSSAAGEPAQAAASAQGGSDVESSASSQEKPEEQASSSAGAAESAAETSTAPASTVQASLTEQAVEQRSVADNELSAIGRAAQELTSTGAPMKGSELSKGARQAALGKRWPGAGAPVFGRKRQRNSAAEDPPVPEEEPSSRAAARHFYQAALDSQQQQQQQTTRMRHQSSSGRASGSLEQPEAAVSEILVQQEPTRITADQASQQLPLDTTEPTSSVAEVDAAPVAEQPGSSPADADKRTPFIRLSNVASVAANATSSAPASTSGGSHNDSQQPMKLMRIYVIDLDQKLVVGDTGPGQQPLQSLSSLQALQSLQLSAQEPPEVGPQDKTSASSGPAERAGEPPAANYSSQQQQPTTAAAAAAAADYAATGTGTTSYELAGEPVAYVPEGYVLLERDSLQANLNQVVAQLESSNRTSGTESSSSAAGSRPHSSGALTPSSRQAAAEQVLPQYRAPQYWASSFNQTTMGGQAQPQLQYPAQHPQKQQHPQPQVNEQQQQVSSARATRQQQQQQLDYWPTRAADSGEPAPQNYYYQYSSSANVAISKPTPALATGHYSQAETPSAGYSARVTPPASSSALGSDQWRPVDYSSQLHWQVSGAGSEAARPPYANKLSAGLLNGPRTTTDWPLYEPTWDSNQQHQANETAPGPAQHAPNSNHSTASHQQVRAGPHPSSGPLGQLEAPGYAPVVADSGTQESSSSSSSYPLEGFLQDTGGPTKGARRPFAAGSSSASEASEAPRIPQPLKSAIQQQQQYQLYKTSSASADSAANSAYMSVPGPPVAGGGVYESQQQFAELAPELAPTGSSQSRRPNRSRGAHRRPNSYLSQQQHHRTARRRPSAGPLLEPASNELYSSASTDDHHYPDFRPAPHHHHHQHHQRPSYVGPKGLLSWETLTSVASGAAKRLPSLSSLLQVPFGGGVGVGPGAMGSRPPASSYPTANQQPAQAAMHLRGLHYERDAAAAFHRPYPFKFMSGGSGGGVSATGSRQQPPAVSYQEEPAAEDGAEHRPQPPAPTESTASSESTGLPDVDAELAAAAVEEEEQPSSKQHHHRHRRPQPPPQKLEPAQEAVLASVELEAAEALRSAPPPVPRPPSQRRPKRPKSTHHHPHHQAPIVPSSDGDLLDETAPFDTSSHPHQLLSSSPEQEQDELATAPIVRPPPHQPPHHAPQSSIQIGQFKLTPQTQFVQSIIEPSRQMLGQYFKQYIGQIGHTLG